MFFNTLAPFKCSQNASGYPTSFCALNAAQVTLCDRGNTEASRDLAVLLYQPEVTGQNTDRVTEQTSRIPATSGTTRTEWTRTTGAETRTTGAETRTTGAERFVLSAHCRWFCSACFQVSIHEADSCFKVLFWSLWPFCVILSHKHRSSSDKHHQICRLFPPRHYNISLISCVTWWYFSFWPGPVNSGTCRPIIIIIIIISSADHRYSDQWRVNSCLIL